MKGKPEEKKILNIYIYLLVRFETNFLQIFTSSPLQIFKSVC